MTLNKTLILSALIFFVALVILFFTLANPSVKGEENYNLGIGDNLPVAIPCPTPAKR